MPFRCEPTSVVLNQTSAGILLTLCVVAMFRGNGCGDRLRTGRLIGQLRPHDRPRACYDAGHFPSIFLPSPANRQRRLPHPRLTDRADVAAFRLQSLEKLGNRAVDPAPPLNGRHCRAQ